MNLKTTILAASVALPAVLSAGCAAGAPEVRLEGIVVPAEWIEVAEHGRSVAGDSSAPDQARACLALSAKLWDRDVLESLRYLRKGAALRDADCCRQYLAHAETSAVNVSQRLYARLFVEGLVRKGALLDRGGQDLRGELYYQLCWAWSYTEPRCPRKARQVLQAMLECRAAPGQLQSAFITQMLRENGLEKDALRAGLGRSREIQMYAGESADDAKRWLCVPLPGERRESADWAVAEANAWGGGTDRLFFASNVLAFLVNDRGEPSFHGTRLWICNLGSTPVYLTSMPVAQINQELRPGCEETFPIVSSEAGSKLPVTGIPLTVRHPRILR